MLLVALLCPRHAFADAHVHEADIVIYGGTSAAVAAAVRAKRGNHSVIIVSPDKHLGGLSAGGLGWTDSGNKAVIGGISLEFYKRVYNYYDKPETWKWQKREAYGNRGQGTAAMDGDGRAMWVFEPHIAERVFEDFIREYKIKLHRDEWLDRTPVDPADKNGRTKGVTLKDGKITEIKTLAGNRYRGKLFIDATYEGDLMAGAGVSYTVGREANSKYGETLNGIQAPAHKHQFTHKISPYKVEGDPSSGLLPRVSADPPGKNGDGDHRVQAYNFRMCLTRHEENRVPFPKPEGYDASQYELLLRTLKAGSRHVRGKFDMLPNLKTDTNNHGSFSTDNIGMNYDYPEASYERRKEIIAEHRTYQQGYCYFLANDPRVPEDVRKWYGAWGLAKDEFKDNGHWPHQIYVREARRMVGDTVVNENHLKRSIPTPRSIGMGSYNMDSHNTQRYVDENGHVRNEGDIQVSPGGPYPIDYGAIIPKKKECQNLLVVCAVSSSHIAYGSIRMEPVFMILGHSAVTAGEIAMKKNIAVQDVSYDELKAQLEKENQVLEYQGGRRPSHGYSMKVINPEKLKGIVVDDAKATTVGAWQKSGSAGPFVGLGYAHDNNEGQGKKTITYPFQVKKLGKYEVRLSYSAHQNRATNVKVTVKSIDGESEHTVNQKMPGKIDKAWVSLGTFNFSHGQPGSVTISNEGANGYVIADAVWVLEAK